MPNKTETTFTGEVTDVFAHRFVVKTATGKLLADLGPAGREKFDLREGEQVTLWGELKPAELKVHAIKRGDGPPTEIGHKHPHHSGEHTDADPAQALKTAAENGYVVIGGARRKPKHFEILGRDRDGEFIELHIELGGALRKTRAVEKDDPKWADVIHNHARAHSL